MPTSFETDPYRTTLDTDVIRVGSDNDRPFAVTADTVFYPEGGGQPADHGLLDDIAVIDVQRIDGEIRHFLERPASEGPAHLRLNWQRRYDHMQQHTAQHLLTAVADTRFNWPTTAFHLGREVSDVELSAPSLSKDDLARLEEAVTIEIRAARRVSARITQATDLIAEGVRTRGLPEGHSGPVRLVEIDGLDLNTCGGTHLPSTSEIGLICLLGTEKLRGGTRLFFAAGDRVRRHLSCHQARCASLRRLLGAPDDELVAAVDLRLSREQELTRTTKRLTKALAELTATTLIRDQEAFITEHWPEHDIGFLTTVARQLSDLATERSALLTAGPDDDGAFVLVVGQDAEEAGNDALKAVKQELNGRGGGRGRLFQGKASALQNRQHASAAVARALNITS